MWLDLWDPYKFNHHPWKKNSVKVEPETWWEWETILSFEALGLFSGGRNVRASENCFLFFGQIPPLLQQSKIRRYLSRNPTNNLCGAVTTGGKNYPTNHWLQRGWITLEMSTSSSKPQTSITNLPLADEEIKNLHNKIPSRELTYPTTGKGKSSSKLPFNAICQFPEG